MGNVAIHDLEPVREDERHELDLSVPMDYRTFCKVIIHRCFFYCVVFFF